MSVDVDLSAPPSLFPLSTRPDNLPGSLDGRGKKPKANKHQIQFLPCNVHTQARRTDRRRTPLTRSYGSSPCLFGSEWQSRRELRVQVQLAALAASLMFSWPLQRQH